jgi:hypothetical protein
MKFLLQANIPLYAVRHVGHPPILPAPASKKKNNSSNNSNNSNNNNNYNHENVIRNSSSPDIIRVMRSRTMRLPEHVARMARMINACIILKGKLEDVTVDGRMILKWILRKYGMRAWSRIICLRTGTVAGSCEDSNAYSGFEKPGILRLFEHLYLKKDRATWCYTEKVGLWLFNAACPSRMFQTPLRKY